jgi:GNAT superfamily N-acetyltransferase
VGAPNGNGVGSSGNGDGPPERVDLTGEGDGPVGAAEERSPVVVRRIRADEGARLRQVRLDAIADSPGAFTTGWEAAAQRPIEAWARVAEVHSAAGDQITLFAEVDGDTAGMISAFRTEDDAVTMTSLWSAPGFRRIGVADELVSAVREWAVGIGAVEVRQWLVERNAHARAFHEALGFAPTGVERPYEPAPEIREVELRLLLA